MNIHWQDAIDEAAWSLIGGFFGYVLGWIRYHDFPGRNK